MNISEKGISLIKSFEGFSPSAYKCPAGVWTIGYGFTSGVKSGDSISEDEANKRLILELKNYEKAVSSSVKVALSQNQFDALISFVYNVGESAFKKSTLLKLINKGDYSGACAQFSRWDKAGGKVVKGLSRRRRAEAELFDDRFSEEPMVQSVDQADKPVIKSRTLMNASAAGIVGTAVTIAPAIQPAGEVVEIVQKNPQGFMIVVGCVIIAFSAIAIYLKIDDRRKL